MMGEVTLDVGARQLVASFCLACAFTYFLSGDFVKH